MRAQANGYRALLIGLLVPAIAITSGLTGGREKPWYNVAVAASSSSNDTPSAAPSPCPEIETSIAAMTANGLTDEEQAWVTSMVELLRPADRAGARWAKVVDPDYTEAKGRPFLVIVMPQYLTSVAAKEYAGPGLSDPNYWDEGGGHEYYSYMGDPTGCRTFPGPPT